MKSLEEQFRKIITDSVPKNIDLAIPVGQDIELKNLLEQLVAKVNENSKQIEALRRDIYRIERKINYNKGDYFPNYYA